MAATSGALLDLRRDLAQRGFTKKLTGRVILELAIHVAVAIAGLAIVAFSNGVLVRAAGLVLSTLGAVGIGSNTHTSTHFASSNKRWVNELLAFFGFPFFMAMSATYWWRKHVQIHHSAPNVIGVDEDADLLPWFALTERDVATDNAAKRWYFKHVQWWIFPFALAGNGFQIQATGWTHLIRCLTSARLRKREHWIDLAAMTMHYAVWVGIPCLFFPALHVLVLYFLRIVLIGYGLYAVVAPGHLPAEAARVDSSQERADYALLQTACTVNFRTGVIGRWFCSGLEYQIEHHLFPAVSHVHYPKLSPVVREFCQTHGLPYRSYSWPKALWMSWAAFRHAQPVHPKLEELRVGKF